MAVFRVSLPATVHFMIEAETSKDAVALAERCGRDNVWQRYYVETSYALDSAIPGRFLFEEYCLSPSFGETYVEEDRSKEIQLLLKETRAKHNS